MTQEEEDAEKQRVKSLTKKQQDQELRKLNREIAKLNMLVGINTGELYTWRGKFKTMVFIYGFPLWVWYYAVYTSTLVLCYGAIEIGGVDTMALIAQIDALMGWNLVSVTSPEVGKIGMAFVLNDLLEPVRLPVVIVTVKPVADRFFPTKF